MKRLFVAAFMSLIFVLSSACLFFEDDENYYQRKECLYLTKSALRC